MNVRHVVINSNQWFSAVTDYSFQLSRFLNENGGVLVCTHAESPLLKKSFSLGLETCIIPFVPYGFVAFLRCWIRLSSIIKSWSSAAPEQTKKVVWTFEGREHTLCALHRILNRSSWKNVTLVRVRGQAQPIRASFFNRMLYLKLTDKVIFAAAAVARPAPFYFEGKRAMVQLYCAPAATAIPNNLKSYLFLPTVPQIDFSRPVFLIVGRYDPVKGHAKFFEAFAKANFNDDFVQLVCIGESQNIKMAELFETAKTQLGHGEIQDNRAYASDKQGNKRIYFFDERIANIRDWMASSHFGCIPSLGSEVICRVAVEFLQAGTPVLASYVGALNEVLSGTPCRVYSANSEQQTIDSLKWAAERFSDSESYRKMRDECLRVSAKYNLDCFSKVLVFVNS